MASFVSRHLEYLLLALLALAAAAVVVVADRDNDQPALRRSATPERERAAPDRRPSGIPTCGEARITPASDRTGTCRTSSSLLTIVNDDDLLRVGALRLRVRGATTLRATTPSGRARDRMRLTLDVELTNGGSEPYALLEGEHSIYVAALGQRVEPDPNAASAAGAFAIDAPVAPRETRAGTLRFELAGGVTRSIVRDATAQLGLRVADDRIGVVRVRLLELRAG
jgi:hypothetical protein